MKPSIPTEAAERENESDRTKIAHSAGSERATVHQKFKSPKRNRQGPLLQATIGYHLRIEATSKVHLKLRSTRTTDTIFAKSSAKHCFN